MWRLLRERRPEVLVVVSPPVVALIVGWLWSLVHPGRLVVDCHTGAFHSPKWGWTLPIQRFALRRARCVLLHTDADEARVRAWGMPALLVPDDVPDAADAATATQRTPAPRVVVAGSLDWNEPVAAALAAAALLPEVEVRITGDIARLPASLRTGSSANVVFTGFLPYQQFLAELAGADLVAAFSTDPSIMNRAAFEAIGLGRPLVLSDLPALRARFGAAALLCPNDPAAMARTIRQALQDRELLVQRSQALQWQLRAQREAALARLRIMLEMPRRPPRLPAGARTRPRWP
jgi:glycosyltransferase involved in cell wall biosynthesis